MRADLCVFDGNVADETGGAVNINAGDSQFERCNFTNNRAPNGGAIRVGWPSNRVPAPDYQLKIRDGIFMSNSAEVGYIDPPKLAIARPLA